MYRRNVVFSAACLGMLVFGIVLTSLGSLLPMLIPKYGISKIEAGSLMSLLSIGILLGSLVFGPIVDRYGYKFMLTFSALFIVLGLEGIAWTSDFWILRISVFLIGAGGGVINGATNALVADISEEERGARLSLLGIFFGIGAVGMPFLLGLLLDYMSYEIFTFATGLFVLIPVIVFISIRFPVPKQAQGFPIKEGAKLLRNALLLAFGLILFFESGMEITVGSWTATFLKEELHIAEDRAVFLLSTYWIGMVLIRLLLGFLLKRQSSLHVLLVSLGTAFIGAVIMMVSQHLTLTVVALFLLGSGFAAGFPVILGRVGDLFPRLSGTAFSIVFVIALIGGSTVPFITGVIAESQGLQGAFITIPLSLLVMFILIFSLKKKMF